MTEKTTERILKKRRKREKAKKRWRLFQSLFFITLLALATFALLKSSFLNIDKITVKGIEQVEAKDIKALASIGIGQHILKINLEEATDKVKIHPKVKNVEIKRSFPREIIIDIEERQALALIPASEGFIKVDSEGVILESINTVAKLNLPLITGIEVKEQVPGAKIVDEKLRVAFKFLESMPTSIKGKLAEISAENSHQIIVYTLSSTQIRLGSEERLPEKFRMLETVLLNNPSKNIEYIDISTENNPVFKMKAERDKN